MADAVACVAFDLDDTLYPERAFVRSGFRAVSDFLLDTGVVARPIAGNLEAAFDAGVRGTTFNRVLAEAGVVPEVPLIRRCVEVYRTHRWPGGHRPVEITLYADAARALAALAEAGVRMALVSDGPLAGQRAKVEALGLEEKLDAVVLTDAWGRAYWKPHPRAFREVASRLAGAPGRCVYVADNPAKDFAGPNAAGWAPSVRLRRPDGLYAGGDAPPDGPVRATVATLDALADVLPFR